MLTRQLQEQGFNPQLYDTVASEKTASPNGGVEKQKKIDMLMKLGVNKEQLAVKPTSPTLEKVDTLKIVPQPPEVLEP